MADPRHDLGRAAEQAVAEWLTSHRWRIVAARHRSASGELDLVAVDPGQCLVAVEVRLRRTTRTGDAASSVRPGHLRRVRATLVDFSRRSAVRHTGLRVDLVTVVPGPRERTWKLTRLPGVDAW